MAASRSLIGCLVLWLIASGCESSSIRWSAFQRQPDESQSDQLADRESRETSSQPPQTLETASVNDSTTHIGGGHSQFAGRSSDELADRAIREPGHSLQEMQSPPERGASFSGHIDSFAEDSTSESEQFASHVAPLTNDHAAPVNENSSPAEEPVVESDSSSPWGLPRIPDVLAMARRGEENHATDWTWGIGQHLLPGGRTGESETSEDPVRTASMPETLPPNEVVWGDESAYSQEELAKLIALIEAELANVTPTTESQRRDYLRRHVLLRHLYLLAGRPHDAQQAIPGIDPDDQEFWSEMYWAMSSYFDEEMLPSRGDRAAQTVGRLASAERALQPQVPLEIRNLQFCRQINSFGNYETFGVNEFSPGQPINLYIEVRHFESESDPSGVFRTLLESEIEIYSEGPSRELIDRTVFPTTEDLSRSRREDYFHSYRIELPSTLQPGAYILQLTVEDRLTGKSAAVSRRFVVVPASRFQ